MIGRVHWFLFELSPSFKGAYRLCCDYRYHSYFFYRNDGRNGKSIFMRDCFSVVRSSRRCWRVIFVDCRAEVVVYHSFQRRLDVADFMEDIFRYGYDYVKETRHPP